MRKTKPVNESGEPEAISVQATARRTGISRGLLYGLWKDGLGPRFIKIRNRRLVRVADLRSWLESLGAQTPTR